MQVNPKLEESSSLWCRPNVTKGERERRISRKSFWTPHSSKKIFPKLREHFQEKDYPLERYYSLQGCPSPRSPSCSLIDWEQPKGSMVLIWTPRWAPRGSSWSLVCYLYPHHLSRFFRRWSALWTLWLPLPVCQKANGENGGRDPEQKKDKSSRCYPIFLQERKNEPCLFFYFHPSVLWIFTFLHSSGCVIIRFWRWLQRKRYKTDFMHNSVSWLSADGFLWG